MYRLPEITFARLLTVQSINRAAAVCTGNRAANFAQSINRAGGVCTGNHTAHLAQSINRTAAVRTGSRTAHLAGIASQSHSFSTSAAVSRSRAKEVYRPSLDATLEIRKAVEGIVQADKALLRAKLPIKPWQLYVKERANTTTADIPEEGPKRGAAFVRLKKEFDNLPKEEQERYGVMSAKKRDELEQRKAKKKVLPKKSLSPYNIFVRERFPFCPTDMTAKDYLAALALDFKKLTPKQLAKYVEESRKDEERVKRALAVLLPDPKSKRSPTAYTLFIRDNLRAHSDGGPMREAMVKAGAAWRTAAPEVRIKYETMARDMAPAGQKHPETRTRAPTAYNFYLQELARRRVEGESLADVMKTAGALWKTLDASERERYDHLAKVGKIKFLEEKEKDSAHDVRVT